MGGAGYHHFMTRTTNESSQPAESRAARYPLHITLAAVFVTALVVFGVAVIAYGYFEGRRIELVGADDLMDRIGRQLSADIAGLYQPAQGLVDITSKSAIWAGDTLEERMAALPPVAEALALNAVDLLVLRRLGGRRLLPHPHASTGSGWRARPWRLPRAAPTRSRASNATIAPDPRRPCSFSTISCDFSNDGPSKAATSIPEHGNGTAWGWRPTPRSPPISTSSTPPVRSA